MTFTWKLRPACKGVYMWYNQSAVVGHLWQQKQSLIRPKKLPLLVWPQEAEACYNADERCHVHCDHCDDRMLQSLMGRDSPITIKIQQLFLTFPKSHPVLRTGSVFLDTSSDPQTVAASSKISMDPILSRLRVNSRLSLVSVCTYFNTSK